MGTTPDALVEALGPIVAAISPALRLHDVELGKGLVRVSVAGVDGVDLDQLAEVNRAISAHLDENEPFDGRYTLEVSSPGVERKLRRPEHFASAIGETVAIRTTPEVEMVPSRRIEGQLLEATGDGIVVSAGGEDVALHYDQIERARTVFDWALGKKKPSPSRGGAPKKGRAKTATTNTTEKVMTP